MGNKNFDDMGTLKLLVPGIMTVELANEPMALGIGKLQCCMGHLEKVWAIRVNKWAIKNFSK